MKDKKTVLLGVTGGIAAYKTVYVASGLKKKGYDVRVVMTEGAAKFVTPLTFETMSSGRVCTDAFDPANDTPTMHIDLAHKADLVLIAPATANTIAKLAHGIADNMLTTTVLACTCPKIIAPAMNTDMYENPATQDNLSILKDYGFEIIEPAEGMLACGVEGKGKMPEPDVLISYVEQAISKDKDMAGLKVLVTAGPTEEAVDPVRFITNHSSGKMGYAIARMAARRGADVTLVSGRTALPREPFVETVDILSAEDMFNAVTSRAPEMDIVIKAAAVADFTPANPAPEKIKKSDLINAANAATARAAGTGTADGCSKADMIGAEDGCVKKAAAAEFAPAALGCSTAVSGDAAVGSADAAGTAGAGSGAAAENDADTMNEECVKKAAAAEFAPAALGCSTAVSGDAAVGSAGAAGTAGTAGAGSGAAAENDADTVNEECVKKACAAAGAPGMSIALKPTRDILQYLGDHRHEGQFLCGFAMETEHLLENASAKLGKKHVDMICANSLRTKGAGFAGDTNILTIITKSGTKELPLMSKLDAADAILDEIMRMR